MEDVFKFCGLVRISELYWPLVDTWIWHGYPGVPFEKSSFSDLNHQKHFNIIMFHFISQRFAPSVEPLVFGYGSKETLHIQSSTWPRGVCQLGHGHRGCLLQMCSRLHHSPQVQQWSQSQRGNWLLQVKYLLVLHTYYSVLLTTKVTGLVGKIALLTDDFYLKANQARNILDHLFL